MQRLNACSQYSFSFIEGVLNQVINSQVLVDFTYYPWFLPQMVFFWVHVISPCPPPRWLIAPKAHGKAIVPSKWWKSVCLVFCKKNYMGILQRLSRLSSSKRALQCPSTYTTPGHCCYGIIWVKVNITKLGQITKATNSLKTNWNAACSVLPCGNSNE